MRRNPVAILGIPIDCFTMDETIQYIFHLMECYASDKKSRLVCTANTDFIVNTLSWDLKKTSHPELLDILRKADLVTADGMPIVWTSKLLGPAIPHRVTGSDLVPKLAEQAALRKKSIYFLGGYSGSAKNASVILKDRYQGLVIAGWDSPFVHIHGKELANAYENDEDIVARINASKADILFIAFGNPKQEIWFERNRHRLQVPVSIGIGGTFDFITGEIARAPVWMRDAGLEWLFRFIQDPRRLWKRYLVDFLKFGFLLWPSIISYRYAKAVAPHDYLKRCKGKVSYKYMTRGSEEVFSVTLPGAVDRETASRVESIIPKRPMAHLIIDFTDTAFIDSAGLGFLMKLMLDWSAGGYDSSLVGLNPSMKKCLAYNRLHDLCSSRQFTAIEDVLEHLDTKGAEHGHQTYLEEEEGVSTIKISGDLRPAGIPLNEIKTLASLVRTKTCTIDLSKVISVNSSGVIFLLKLKSSLKELSKSCTVTGATGSVEQMLKKTKTWRLL